MLGRELGEAQAERPAGASHYIFGGAGGPAAQLLAVSRRSPLKAGLGVGTALETIVDHGMNTALGLTAPPRAWPWQAHARGMAAHAVYGAALGLLLGSGERTH